MLHRDIEIVDLDPLTWRNLGDIFSISDWADSRPDHPNVISILHDEGNILTVEAAGAVGLNLPDTISDPRALARQIFENVSGLARVQIFEKSRLIAYSDAVQRLDWQNLMSVEFYLKAWQIAEGDPVGLCYYPTTPFESPFLEWAQSFVATVPDGNTLVIGVFDQGKPYFSLILRVNSGKIGLATTFDMLVRYGLDTERVPSSIDDAKTVISLVETHIGPVAHALFCDRPTLLAHLSVLRGTVAPTSV